LSVLYYLPSAVYSLPAKRPGGGGVTTTLTPGTPDDNYNNPNAGVSRELAFSHNSGLYAQPFSLTITAAAGSSIYYSTDGSVPSPEKAGNGFVFEYTSPITVQDRNGQANVLATVENTEQMYLVPDDPNSMFSLWGVPSIYIPNDDQVPKATVIRAIAVDSGGKQSGVLTKTYFIGDNLANYGSNRVISLVTDPYNLIDEYYGIMVRGTANKRWPNYNLNMKGQEWEREAYLELFEGNESARSIQLSTGVGIRVRGGFTRAYGQKSFNVYFREEYGINNLRNYNLIPGAVKADGKTPVERYKSFMLRNGGSDARETKFHDVFIQDLLSDRSFTTQAAVPCIVYLNGEYWGPYNLQERYSDNHTEYKYGVRRENVISLDNGELDDGTQADLALYNQMINMRNNDMSNPANYNDFCAVFDIENFIDYFAAQIYIYNWDWPHNNYRLWRTRNVEAGNLYGDTKWRWQMLDTDHGLNWVRNGSLIYDGKDAFDRILTGTYRNMPNNLLFKALLANEDFCRRFVNTMMDLHNVNFHPDTFGPLLDKYANTYRPLMGDTNTPGTYFSRWGRSRASIFQEIENSARNYLLNIRDVMVNNYLPKYFGGYSGIANIGISGGNLCDITISTTGASGASVKVNTVTVSGNWTGKYYAGNLITVTASPAPNGYEFDGWTVTGGSADNPSALTTAVNITGNAQITAKYK
jgi:hypothetical protein